MKLTELDIRNIIERLEHPMSYRTCIESRDRDIADLIQFAKDQIGWKSPMIDGIKRLNNFSRRLARAK